MLRKRGKRTFSELRGEILKSLIKGQKTINQISRDTGINWKTVESHITHLVGKRLIKEVLSSEYVRIYELSDEAALNSNGETIRRIYIRPSKQIILK